MINEREANLKAQRKLVVLLERMRTTQTIQWKFINKNKRNT